MAKKAPNRPKTVFCDFDRGNWVLLSPKHFKSILWSKIRLGKGIRSVWCTEQKIPVSSKSFYYSSYHIHKTCESMEGEISTTKSSEYSTRISSIAVTVNVIHTSLYTYSITVMSRVSRCRAGRLATGRSAAFLLKSSVLSIIIKYI